MRQAGEIVVSPGISLKTPEIAAAIAAGVPVTGDVDVFSRAAAAPIIAVTGSNGKSTVVALLADIMTAAGKNIGLGGNLDSDNAMAALDLLAAGEKEYYLLELSSFQLETTQRLGAEVAVLLNLCPDHLDRYDDLQEYHLAKRKIFNGCKQVVVNRDDVYSLPPEDLHIPRWEFGLSAPTAGGLGLLAEGSERYLAYGTEKIVALRELKVFGSHNLANALAACAVALAVGIELPSIRVALRRFAGLPHRCQWVADIEGVAIYNDSKGTNVGATLAAVAGLGAKIDGGIVLIAGGDGKGADFRPLAAMEPWLKAVILIGRDGAEVAAGIGPHVEKHFAPDLTAALSAALNRAARGDAILLSPACASFDMFDSYQQRGTAFVKAVEALQ